jgi:hypothetical protein
MEGRGKDWIDCLLAVRKRHYFCHQDALKTTPAVLPRHFLGVEAGLIGLEEQQDQEKMLDVVGHGLAGQ